jgi:hypothetical protein
VKKVWMSLGVCALILAAAGPAYAQAPPANVGDVVISGASEEIVLPQMHFTSSIPRITGMPDQNAALLLNRRMREMKDAALAKAKASVVTLAPGDGPGRVVEGIFGYEVKRNNRGLISILLSDYLYSGGANGLTVKTGLTFSAADGRVLRLRDLFKNEATYTNCVNEQIMKQLEERQLEAQLLKAFSGITGEETFYVTESALVIVIQELDWFPHAMGSVEFSIPFDRISMALKDFVK